MTALATESMIVDALLYGHICTLRPRPARVVVAADGSVSLDPGTRIVRAPLTHTARRGDYRKWPREEATGQRVINEAGDYVEVEASASASLFGLMAESNCAAANLLGRAQLIAVWWCAVNRPFPGGDGPAIYRRVLATIEADACSRAAAVIAGTSYRTRLGDDVWAQADRMTVGDLRLALVNRCGSGCNAPTDSYLRAAAQLQRGEEPERF